MAKYRIKLMAGIVRSDEESAVWEVYNDESGAIFADKLFHQEAVDFAYDMNNPAEYCSDED